MLQLVHPAKQTPKVIAAADHAPMKGHDIPQVSQKLPPGERTSDGQVANDTNK